MKDKLIRLCVVVLSAVVVAAFAAPAVSLADDSENNFVFGIDPLDVEALFTSVDTNSSKFEEYRDMDGNALIRRLRVTGESGDLNRTLDLDVMNAGRADARYTLRYRNSGRYGVTLDYNIIPHRFGNGATMLHSTRTGVDNLTISDSTQLFLQNSIEAFDPDMDGTINAPDFVFLRSLLLPYIESANRFDTRLERRRARATIDIAKLSKLSWKIDVKQETRNGNRPYGATFGFGNAIELPEPIRYDTKSAEFSGEWRADRGGLRFGFDVSRFENKYDTLSYDNPFRLVDSTDSSAYSSPGTRSIGGPSRGLNVLSPDNRAGRIFVAGHANFGGGWWLNGELSFGRMEQDDDLVAHTVNTAINPSVIDPTVRPPFDASDPRNLPVSQADTKVDITHFTANAGTRIGEQFSVKLRARYYDYNNKSQRVEFPGYVRMDAVWEDVPRITVPYAYTKQKIGAEFGYDPTPKTHLAIGYDLLSWDRDFREVSNSDEDIFHFTVDSRTFSKVTLRGGWEHGKRTTSEYKTEAQLDSFLDPDETINNQPGLRKYDEAERTYDIGYVSALLMPDDVVNVTLGARLNDQDYDKSEFGLLKDRTYDYNAEVSYNPSDTFSLFVFAQRTDRETKQAARQSGSTVSTSRLDDWDLTLSEITNTFGLGLNGRFADRWTWNVSGSLSDADGDSDFFSPPGGTPDKAVSFDEYDDNKWMVYTARLDYRANEHVTAGIMIQRDDFETNRFSRDGLSPYLPSALLLDFNDADYTADIFAVDLKIVF